MNANLHTVEKSEDEVNFSENLDTDKSKIKTQHKQDKKYNILISEDESMNFEVLNVLITFVLNLECNIFHAKNGQEAVDICKSRYDIDIVLMDSADSILWK